MDPDNQMGPLANDRRLAAMETLAADAKAKGARLTAGGERFGNRGYFFPLTVLEDVPDNARAMREEPFERRRAKASPNKHYLRTRLVLDIDQIPTRPPSSHVS